MAKSKSKSTTYPVRFVEPVYNALMEDCKKEHRSLAALINMLAENYLKSKGSYPEKN